MSIPINAENQIAAGFCFDRETGPIRIVKGVVSLEIDP